MALTRGFRLARIAGIDIDIDWSLMIIFTLITMILATGVFPVWHPDWPAALSWGTAVAAAILFFASVLIHEMSHALVGRANGIDVRHITLFVFGGMAHMENEPPSWQSELAMTIVGPITSLVLGMIFLWIGGVIAGPIAVDPDNPGAVFAQLSPAATLCFWLGPVNIILGLFNLVPGFPLDGGRVLRAVIWAVTGNLYLATRWASRSGQAFAWLLMATGFAMILGIQVPIFGGGLINGLWLAFIGWFLNTAAVMGYHQLTLRNALEGVPVTRLMQTRLTRLQPDITVARVIEEHVMESGQRTFPVEEGGRLTGMISLSDLQKIPVAERTHIRVHEVMTPMERLITVTPSTDSMEALSVLGKWDLNQLPVVENGRFIGLVRREDILKWLSLYFPAGEKLPV
ncbi:MAG: site-2 protease family protein [Gammaproteobacteria bacterium]